MCDPGQQAQVPLGELALRRWSDRDAAHPFSVELERGDRERTLDPNLARGHDRLVLLVGDDERLLVGEESVCGLTPEVHAQQPLVVKLRVTVRRAHADVRIRRLL